LSRISFSAILPPFAYLIFHLSPFHPPFLLTLFS
jgi:hypothetical protein